MHFQDFAICHQKAMPAAFVDANTEFYFFQILEYGEIFRILGRHLYIFAEWSEPATMPHRLLFLLLVVSDNQSAQADIVISPCVECQFERERMFVKAIPWFVDIGIPIMSLPALTNQVSRQFHAILARKHGFQVCYNLTSAEQGVAITQDIIDINDAIRFHAIPCRTLELAADFSSMMVKVLPHALEAKAA